MSEELINWLMVSSMVLFNILCLLAIVFIIVGIALFNQLKNKINETLDSIQSISINVENFTSKLSDSFIPRLFTRQKSWVDIVLSLLKR